MAQPKSTYAVFCDMLRHPSAKPLVNRTRNFVEHFPEGLSRYEASERVHNFLTQTETWMFSEIVVFEAEADEQGRANASESLEKFVLCRLHPKVFGFDPSDAEEDAKLKKHIAGLAWVETKHLGIPEVEPTLWPLVMEELRQLNDFKAPCDKLTCIVNACHVINDVLKLSQTEFGVSRPLAADDFLPLLIYAIIKANPPHFHSNAEFAAAFRHPSRLNGEHAYWATMLMSAKEFVRQAGPETLDVSREDFARYYAAALEAADYSVPESFRLINAETVVKDDLIDFSSPDDAAQVIKEDLIDCTSPASATQVPSSDSSVAEVELLQPEVPEWGLLEKEEVLLYKLPELQSSAGHRPDDWKDVIWRGPIKVVGKSTEWAIRMIDQSSGQLFAECLIPVDKYEEYVERVTNSNRHFVLKITSGPRCAHIGLGFEGQDDAADFRTVLNEFESTWLYRDAMASCKSQQGQEGVSSSPPSPDKQGGYSGDADFSSLSKADVACVSQCAADPFAEFVMLDLVDAQKAHIPIAA